MDGRTEFSPGLYITAAAFPKDIVDLLSPGIRASAYIYLPELPSKINTLLVISFEHKNKPYSYTAINLNELKLRPGRWNSVSLSSPIPAFKSPDDMLKVYIWNPAKQVFYLDDFRVEVVK